MKFCLFLFVCAFLVVPSSYGYVLDLDRAIADPTYSDSIKSLFIRITEVQIGGTHISGNRTIVKDRSSPRFGELDPSILIINPTPGVHSDRLDLLSVLGSGCDRELLLKLKQLCEKFSHSFNKIYINNIFLILPLPEVLPDGLLDRQHVFYKSGRDGLPISDADRRATAVNSPILEVALLEYVSRVQTDLRGFDIYSVYRDMLAEGGEFVSKSAGTDSLSDVFHGSFMGTEGYRIEPTFTFKCCIPKVSAKYIYGRDEDEVLFRDIADRLKLRGDTYALARTRLADSIPDSRDPNLRFKLQTFLLKQAGFRVTNVSFARLDSWGYVNADDAYSLVIQAKKNRQKH